MKRDIATRDNAQSLKVLQNPEPLLGAPAFRGCVLTIDYQKRDITIQGAGYDITHLQHHPHDLLLTPEWENGYLPILKGTIAGHPARFALDSACGTIPINSLFTKRWFATSSKSVGTTIINGVQVSTQGFEHSVSGSVMGLQFREYGTPIINLPTHADALVGTAMLMKFRVTIDYARGKILLEPYPVKSPN